ncbi:MAG: glycosyltransferase family 2 protein [Paracoccaceae bacterium]
MTPPDTPQICVILPAYNLSAYIGAAIASLKAQSFAAFEVLVIDDGSTDDTRAQAIAAIGTDPRFRVIHQSNRGLSGARNAGLDLARAPFIAFLDGDDRFDPDFLQVLHDDLHSSTAPWVACGVLFCAPDGSGHAHSAIHGRPEPGAAPTTYPLPDWSDVICHFPSAWNKLYRRDFIGDLRFDDGTWYEDHTFFHRLAAKTGMLRHIPRPLYLYTLEREGQITRADSDRVFEQFAVLETSAEIFRSAGKTGADKALARLATRLFCERLEVIITPDRAARFRREAATFLARHQLQPDWRWDRYISALRVLSLTGDAPVTIRANARDADVTRRLLPDPASALAPFFRLAAPDQPLAKAGLVIDLHTPGPIDHAALAQAAEALLHSDLAAVLVPLIQRPADTAPHILSPDDALDLNPAQHAILTRTAFACQPSGHDPQLRLTEQALTLCAAQTPIAWSLSPIAPTTQRPPPPLRDWLQALDQWHPTQARILPTGWKRRLTLRSVTARMPKPPPQGWRHNPKALLPLLHLWWAGLRRGWIGTPGKIDADTPRVIRRIFRLPPIG